MTRYLKPQPVTRGSELSLGETAAAITGRSLAWVRYRAGAHSGWPMGFARGDIDEVDRAVLLGFDDGTGLIISWAMSGFAEGIDVEAGSADAFPLSEDNEIEAVASDIGPWAGICGATLDGLSVAWHISNQASPDTVWAAQLSFAGSRRVAIALGEVEKGNVRYHPTGLLVFFDEQAFEAYKESVD